MWRSFYRKERQIRNEGQSWTDTDATFPVIQEPLSEIWKKVKGLKENDEVGNICKGQQLMNEQFEAG